MRQWPIVLLISAAFRVAVGSTCLADGIPPERRKNLAARNGGGFLQNLVQPLENQEAVGETVFRILPRSVGVHYGIPVSIQACTKPDLIICLRLELVYQLRPELPGSRPPDLLLIEHVCEQLGEWCTCPCLILGQPRSR